MKKPIHILLVEDEVFISLLMEMQLKDIGYTVSYKATTGENAVIIAKQKHLDMVLMDIRLAGEIDGIEAATSIVEQSNIPIIFTTGYDDKTIRERAEKIKPLGFLIKPLEMSALENMIDSYFI